MRFNQYRQNYAPEAIYGPYEREQPTTGDLVRLWLSGVFVGFFLAIVVFA